MLGDAGELVGGHGSPEASFPHRLTSGKSGMRKMMVGDARDFVEFNVEVSSVETSL